MDFEAIGLLLIIDSVSPMYSGFIFQYLFLSMIPSKVLLGLINTFTHFTIDLWIISAVSHPLLSHLLMLYFADKLKFLGNLESTVISSIISILITDAPEASPYLQFPLYSLYLVFRLLTISKTLNLSPKRFILVLIFSQSVLLSRYDFLLPWLLSKSELITQWAIVSCIGISIICLSNFLGVLEMIQRKLFHLLMLLIFIPGLKDTLLLSVAYTLAVNILIILEAMRPDVPMLNRFFIRFIDSRDSLSLIVTHIYLLVGIGLPVLLGELHKETIDNTAGIVSLGIGDTFACLIGYFFGRIRLPYRKKTLEGLLACFLSMCISSFYLNSKLSTSCLLKILCISLYEAYTLKIDNLVLPIAALWLSPSD